MAYTLMSHGIELGETDLELGGICGVLRPSPAAATALPIFRRLWNAILWADEAIDPSSLPTPSPTGTLPPLEDVRRLLEPARARDAQGFVDVIEQFVAMDVTLVDESGTRVSPGSILVLGADALCVVSQDDLSARDRVFVTLNRA